jgi:hypothetical protein
MLEAHKNTIRAWLRDGLKPIDRRRPILIQGGQLASYVDERRKRRRQPCRPGEFYCFRCRMPKAAAAGTADYLPVTPSDGVEVDVLSVDLSLILLAVELHAVSDMGIGWMS